jgi:hydroxypyruvate reductase
MNRAELRSAALDIFQHVLRAVDARAAVRRAVTIHGSKLRVFNDEFNLAQRPIYVVGAGKAALAMSLGLHDVLGQKVARAVISTTHTATNEALPSTHAVFYGGHPLPNQESFRAAEAAIELLTDANQRRAFVIFLISGGASAMIELPISNNITLEELQAANRQLITCGATIAEINSIRRSFSAVKGGGLVRPLRDGDYITFIVSDTNIGDERSVGSGPTLPADLNAPDPLEVLEKYSLSRTLPASIVEAIRASKVKTVRSVAPSYTLLDNEVAQQAAVERATQLGFHAIRAVDIVEQDVAEGATKLINSALELMTDNFALISGGEFSCVVRGIGRGGRNLETALRCAVRLDEVRPKTETVVLSAGTDGIDGSSFAAGAIVDDTTVARARELEMDPNDFLARSDSHVFFETLGDLIVTGPTGTNVRDVRLVLSA